MDKAERDFLSLQPAPRHGHQTEGYLEARTVNKVGPSSTCPTFFSDAEPSLAAGLFLNF